MSLVLAVISCVWALGLTTLPQESKGWHGIIPLRSTRSDVEGLLGSATGECKCFYETEREKVQVDYARGRCKGALAGWNVPVNTVLRLTITPKQERKFADLRIDVGKYVKFYDDTFTTYYGSRAAGIRYAVSATGILTSAAYIPSTEEQSLRCSGFPTEDISIVDYLPFDSYPMRTWEDTKARLDIFAVQLESQSTMRGFIIIYVGQGERISKTVALAKRIKTYLLNRHSIAPEQIIVMDGGRRERSVIDFFLVAHNMPAPRPSPTMPS